MSATLFNYCERFFFVLVSEFTEEDWRCGTPFAWRGNFGKVLML